MAKICNGFALLYRPLQYKVTNKICKWSLIRSASTEGGTPTESTSAAAPKPPSATVADVPGLSSAVYKMPTGEVGPGASKAGAYKNPEYFAYSNTSYFEAEIEMLKYRLPQPSSKLK